MRLSVEYINKLKVLLKDLDLDYTDEQVQETGLAIMRFTLAKKNRELNINKNIGVEYGK